jgi:AmmeMemoRadiSam system protein B/AmmeMemoRadiSam system protein A
MFFNTQCSSQDKGPAEQSVNRQPYAAGKFYPGNAGELRTELKDLFSLAVPKKTDNVVAIICPHAGYVFSGEVAASSYDQIDRNRTYKNIFILASSHVKYFDGASIYTRGDYITPLGTVKVNRELGKELMAKSKLFMFDSEADAYEHSVEVQLPFLQYILKQDFTIVPIILGTQDPGTCRTIAGILKPYLNSDNLFVISTDFSHYPAYRDAVTVDSITAHAVLKNSTEALLTTLNDNAVRGIQQLATSMCGWTSVLTLLYMTQDNPEITITPIQYMNSGDGPYGDKSRVVGYESIVFSLNKPTSEAAPEFRLTEEDKTDLLAIARNTIKEYIRNRKMYEVDDSKLSDNVKTPCGAFVTLYKNGDLRGCIGLFSATEPLYVVVQKMAIASSTEDTRFMPVTADEIPGLNISISVLTPMKKINSIDEIVLGRDGIYIKKGFAGGTFLPQVATETGWTKEEFLGHCARDKAGIGWDGWKNADIYTYQANVFSENGEEK